MMRFWISWFLTPALAFPLAAQAEGKASPAAVAETGPAAAAKTAPAAGAKARPVAEAKTSPATELASNGAGAAGSRATGPAGSAKSLAVSREGRAALLRCRELAGRARGLMASARLTALAEAAANYDRVADGFASEPTVAARAAFAAAELWRRHGSLAIAERSYATAAKLARDRFGARGLLGVADMQRRLGRRSAALATYTAVIEGFAAVGHAQAARLARVRLLRGMGRLELAVTGARAALECARPGRQLFDACNLLALLLVESGDLDGAEAALVHARKSVEAVPGDDPIRRKRWQKAVDELSGWRALRRAKDRATGAARDAVRFDQDRRSVVPGPRR